MTESKPNANFLYAFTPILVGERLGEHAEAARTAINDHTAALRELFVSQAQSGCDRLFTSVGKLSEATSPAERMNVLSAIMTEGSRANVDNLKSWAQLYSRHYAGFVGSFSGKPS